LSESFGEDGLAEAGGALLDVIAARKAVIPQEVAVVPKLLDKLGRCGHGPPAFTIGLTLFKRDKRYDFRSWLSYST